MAITPLIGVSSSELRNADRAHPAAQSEPRRPELALGIAYLEAIERAGGLPVILAPVEEAAVPALLDRLDGLCLSGGPDLDPSSYDEPAHPELGPTEPHLDRFELALARGALARRLPMLAICRGTQLLNVACGGSLIQHVPDLGAGLAHRAEAGEPAARHAITVEPASRLAMLLGTSRTVVNSIHHQAVDVLGSGLEAVAWAADGLVEGVEHRGPQFAVGVQWHAECLPEAPAQRRLFEGFLSAACAGAAVPRPRRRERALAP